MKMCEAIKLIEGKTNGFMVSFEWLEGIVLRSDYFPDKHGGEDLIATETEAWLLAREFASAMKGRVVNVYVVKDNFVPVGNYKGNLIPNR